MIVAQSPLYHGADHTAITTIWMNRIKAANPILAAVALGIATQSTLDPAYNADDAIRAKLAEWEADAASQTGRALRYAVIYYQEDVAALGTRIPSEG